jgi:hypothetical protein
MGFMIIVLGYSGTGAINVFLNREIQTTPRNQNYLIPILYGIFILIGTSPYVLSLMAMGHFRGTGYAVVYSWIIIQFMLNITFQSPGTIYLLTSLLDINGMGTSVNDMWKRRSWEIILFQSGIQLTMILNAYIHKSVLLDSGKIWSPV